MNLKSLQPVLPADHSSLKEGRTMIIINFLKMGEAAEKHYRKLLRDSLHELNAYRGGHVCLSYRPHDSTQEPLDGYERYAIGD